MVASEVMEGSVEPNSDKEHAHHLIERLPETQISTAVRFLEFMLLDPAARAVVIDEPVTDEDRRRLRDGQAWFAQRCGQGVSMEDVLADFGSKIEDFPLGK
jgi:hypothetical protein